LLRRAGFRARDKTFEAAANYSEWKFVTLCRSGGRSGLPPNRSQRLPGKSRKIEKA